MRVYDNGSFYTVTVSRAEVDAFKRQYPCSGLPSRALWFQFDKRNGDIVELSPGSERFDGPALLALSQDAQAYGVRRLNKPHGYAR